MACILCPMSHGLVAWTMSLVCSLALTKESDSHRPDLCEHVLFEQAESLFARLPQEAMIHLGSRGLGRDGPRGTCNGEARFAKSDPSAMRRTKPMVIATGWYPKRLPSRNVQRMDTTEIAAPTWSVASPMGDIRPLSLRRDKSQEVALKKKAL